MIRPAFFQNQELPQGLGVLLVIIVALGVAAILYKVFGSLNAYARAQADIKNLLETGEPAEAKILKMWDTGRRLNRNPKIGLRLEISPAGRASYEVEVEYLVALVKLPQVQTGSVVSVKIDRRDASKVALDLA